jgi:hypothetical protein
MEGMISQGKKYFLTKLKATSVLIFHGRGFRSPSGLRLLQRSPPLNIAEVLREKFFGANGAFPFARDIFLKKTGGNHLRVKTLIL